MKKEKDNYNDFNEMVTDHRSVLKLLLTKDGQLEQSEVNVINATNNAFGKQLHATKLKLETAKLLGVKPDATDPFVPSPPAKATP